MSNKKDPPIEPVAQDTPPAMPIIYVLEGGHHPGEHRAATFAQDPDPDDIWQRTDIKVQATPGDFPGEDLEVRRVNVPHDEINKVPGSWHWVPKE